MSSTCPPVYQDILRLRYSRINIPLVKILVSRVVAVDAIMLTETRNFSNGNETFYMNAEATP